MASNVRRRFLFAGCLILIGCSDGGDPTARLPLDRPPASATATPTAVVIATPNPGPLVLVSAVGGEDGMAPGTLEISGDCVLLRVRGQEDVDLAMTLVWPAGRTTWDEASEAVRYVNNDGTVVAARSGDRVILGGAIADAPEQWLQPPGRDCPSTLWEVSAMRLAPG